MAEYLINRNILFSFVHSVISLMLIDAVTKYVFFSHFTWTFIYLFIGLQWVLFFIFLI